MKTGGRRGSKPNEYLEEECSRQSKDSKAARSMAVAVSRRREGVRDHG